MKPGEPFFSVPEWAREDLARVRRSLREGLPPALHGLWEGGDPALPPGGDDPLRPYLVLLVARSLGGDADRAVRLAAAVQRIHLAALLHDRLGADLRLVEAPQAGPAAGKGPRQREAMDILLGDFMFTSASCTIIEDGQERIVRDMIDTSVASAEAQAALVSLERDPGPHGPGRCFEIVAEKVSLLLSLSLRVGAVIGDAPDGDREPLTDFGACFGKALRIVEDLACWTPAVERAPAACGPAAYHHPLLLLWEREGVDAWKSAVLEIPQGAGGIPAGLRARLEAAGCARASLEQARAHAGRALRVLEGRPGAPWGSGLRALVRDLLARGERFAQGGVACAP